MRNPDLPKLLRDPDMAILMHVREQAAIELEKLEKIYELAEDIHDTDGILLGLLQQVLNDGH